MFGETVFGNESSGIFGKYESDMVLIEIPLQSEEFSCGDFLEGILIEWLKDDSVVNASEEFWSNFSF